MPVPCAGRLLFAASFILKGADNKTNQHSLICVIVFVGILLLLTAGLRDDTIKYKKTRNTRKKLQTLAFLYRGIEFFSKQW